MAKKGDLEEELATCERRLAEYREGLALFEAYAKIAKNGHEELEAWNLAARNLINRAEASQAPPDQPDGQGRPGARRRGARGSSKGSGRSERKRIRLSRPR